ncbi:TonB-dependent receptor plug domain-containing protein [Aureibacter tunicatorum]|uniref:Outer membrane receptor for ferrienterochelin and colicins n=1 Tax=Aureibacter tunicatorum TaxID=866807 RepID=A0AAE4BVU0_9BACT|nr:TonB-dependent receptor [Aureibacter tunicatorum]MDR6242038.1 outer membrane receptor for ferrienterochelin and colicins [Aureibacter tunicatorum]
MRVFLTVVMAFACFMAFAQSEKEIIILNLMSKEPIAEASLVDKDQKIVAVSESNGKIVGDFSGVYHVFAMGYDIQKYQTSETTIDTVFLKVKSYDFDEIVVTGQMRPTSVRESLYKVDVIGIDQMQSRGAVNLTDILANEMNARIVHDNILGSNLILQGIAGENVKILLDGVPQLSGAGGGFDLSQVNLHNAEKVEIVHGPQSVQYGTSALAGTVNIISKTLEEEKWQGGLSAYYESVGQYNADIALGRQWKKWNINLGGGRNEFTGYASPMVTEARRMNWNPKVQYLGNAKIFRDYNKLRVGFIQHFFHESNTSKGAPDPSTGGRTANDHLTTSLRMTSGVFANGEIGKNWYLNILNSYQIYSRNTASYLVNLNDESSKKRSEAEDEFALVNARGSVTRSQLLEDRLNVLLGYDYSMQSASGERIDKERDDLRNLGVFTSVNAKIGENVETQLGLRYEYNNTYDADIIKIGGVHLPLIPSLNIKWNMGSKDHFFRFSMAKGFRVPSMRELYYDFQDANHDITGNRDLGAEVSDNFILSGSYVLVQEESRKASINPFIYYNRIHDKIESVYKPSDAPVGRTYENIPYFQTQGVNINVSWEENNQWSATVGSGLLGRTGTDASDQFFWSPELSLQSWYRLKLLQTKFSLYYKYNGALAQFELDEEKGLVDRTLGDYHFLDVSATRAFFHESLIVTLGCKNVMNVTDVEQTGEGSKGLTARTGSNSELPIAWGRTAFLKLTYNINQ